MVDLLHILGLVCILISPRTFSQPSTWEMYSILVHAHEQACIPEVSECNRGFGPPLPRQTSTPLPRQTNHSLPASNGDRDPREASAAVDFAHAIQIAGNMARVVYGGTGV